MQRSLVVLACAASVAVGALCVATATVYAAPLPSTSQRLTTAPRLVVPANYRPASFARSEVSVEADGLQRVAPEQAFALDGTDSGTPSVSDPGDASIVKGTHPENHTPDPTAPTPTAPTPTSTPPAAGDSGVAHNSTNNGKDQKNKVNGSNKNKGSSNGKGHSGTG